MYEQVSLSWTVMWSASASMCFRLLEGGFLLMKLIGQHCTIHWNSSRFLRGFKCCNKTLQPSWTITHVSEWWQNKTYLKKFSKMNDFRLLLMFGNVHRDNHTLTFLSQPKKHKWIMTLILVFNDLNYERNLLSLLIFLSTYMSSYHMLIHLN